MRRKFDQNVQYKLWPFVKGVNFTWGKSEHINHLKLPQIGLPSKHTTRKTKQFKLVWTPNLFFRAISLALNRNMRNKKTTFLVCIYQSRSRSEKKFANKIVTEVIKSVLKVVVGAFRWL